MRGIALLLGMVCASPCHAKPQVTVFITPSAVGKQLVRFSLPLRRGFLREGETLQASSFSGSQRCAVRVLTRHPGIPASARRVLVTFPCTFTRKDRVRFTFHGTKSGPVRPLVCPFGYDWLTRTFRIWVPSLQKELVCSLLAPERATVDAPREEEVESNEFFSWKRFHFTDSLWPRVVDVRADSLGQVSLIASVQRQSSTDGYAPDIGWEVRTSDADPLRPRISEVFPLASSVAEVPLWVPSIKLGTPHTATRNPFALQTAVGSIVYDPLVRERTGQFEEIGVNDSSTHTLLAIPKWDDVPMQPASWRRAQIVISRAGLPSLSRTFQYSHNVEIDSRQLDALYQSGRLISVKDPGVGRLLKYHQDAIVRSACVGNDAGNVTGYSDGSDHGGAFGMNRLNHCVPIFIEGWRSNDRRLIDTALAWCDNFYDQSIWWGKDQTGGTRYNNVVATGKTPLDNKYMWRSNSSVSFCTKGFDAFFLAYEETGDPRMLEALNAQFDYVAKHVDAGVNYTRNIGIVRDLMNLYRWTGESKYLNEPLRLFSTLRPLLSTGRLFTESGKPITANPPFIEEDKQGYANPFAKPYILGYALEGLPELLRIKPNEPELRRTVEAVADFMASSQDPVGGWRYPHPRSSYVIMSQGMEHAWQLVQADKVLGPKKEHLDAIARVLRQRIQGWLKTGKVFGGLTGWETATGKAKDAAAITAMYGKPEDRDPAKDYELGRPDFGSSPPEGIVYFPEVLDFYLKHRPLNRLLEAPKDSEPLGKVLQRAR